MDGDDELLSSPHLIYHPSSPGFDIPDYLPLRRVKPLPKRKHTSSSSPDLARSLPLNTTTTMLPPILPPPPGPDATAEELIAHAEVLSAQITFQSYFLPALTGVTDFTTTTTTTTTTSSRNVVDMPLSVDPSSPAELLDDVTPLNHNEERENDHTDQTQQQGNAKKRKVPAHISGLQMGPDSADVHSGEEEGKKQQPGGERVPPSFSSPATSAAMASPEEELFQVGAEGGDGHQGKLLPATMVGLRKKQVLKHRRRQLAGLLGSLSLGDSLALDQALLANYTLVNEKRSGSGSGGGGSSSISSIRNARHKSRLIRRRASRVVRRHRTLPPRPPSEPTRRIFPDSEFTFLSSNAASERLIATRAEYTVLCDRFEHEIEQQREKDVESAKESTTGVGLGGSGSGSGGSSGDGATTAAKRNEPAMRKARTTTQTVQDAETPGVSKSPSSAKTSGKKKKRSALANASNPHHLRNYVPSRIPNQGLLSAAQLGANTQNMLSPLPLVFLSAQIPPRRGTAQRPPAVASQLTSQGEEWICPTCEYRLFYGDEQGYRMGVRNRKKILKRRRRARERAAAAANGSGTGVGIHGKGSGFDDEEDLDIERTGSGLALSERRLASVERDKGGGDREEREEVGAAG